MPLPYKEPSQTLLQLMTIVVQAGQRFASIADMQVGDGNQQAAVGTTVALLERGSRVMSAIHKRIYASLKQEFALLSNVLATYLPPVYPYDVIGDQKEIKQADFDDKIDIMPVADPNIFSQTQRIATAQTELQLAQSNPQMHNLYEAYRDMYHSDWRQEHRSDFTTSTSRLQRIRPSNISMRLVENLSKPLVARIIEPMSPRT